MALFSEVVLHKVGLLHIGNFPTATVMSYMNSFGDVPPLFSLVALLLHLPPLPQLTNLITAATIYRLSLAGRSRQRHERVIQPPNDVTFSNFKIPVSYGPAGLFDIAAYLAPQSQ